MDLTPLLTELSRGFASFGLGNAIMVVAGLILIYLAIAKEYEPNLLIPIGVGCILANIGMAVAMDSQGTVSCTLDQNFLTILYCAGIKTELFPLLIFVGVGAMIDFTPLLAMPQMVVLGAAGQFGIYATLILATFLGFDLKQSASIGVIGAIDGPTAIFVATKLAPELLGAIAVAAYSYMSLIPVIQPPIMKLLTTRKERLIRMEYSPRPVSKRALVIFPIVVTVVISLLAPQAAPLIATLMLGNFLRVSGVVERLNKSVQNELINMSTLFLGLTIGATMTAARFLNWQTAGVLGLGLLAFIIDTAAGLLFGKLMAVISRGKINPLIGACGISAFPMAARLSAKTALDEDFDNYILMHAMGSNTAGQLGSVVAGGLLLVLATSFLPFIH
jgi:sodium ion-translocating decarboxylase beta subunit